MRTETYEMNDDKVVIPIAESYKDCMTLIKSDRYRISGQKESSVSIIFRNLKPFAPSVLFWLRLCQYKGWLYPICKYMYLRISRRCQVQISPTMRIGYGFYVGHGMGMVIYGGTVIGNNVNLSQFLNIGTNHAKPAIIGDNVYIAPSVCIVEDVIIGNNATIGAGAVVVKDVPDNATVAGVPARVLNYDDPGRYVVNRWVIQ